MRTSVVLRAKIAEAIVNKLLIALENSSWKDNNPTAYKRLEELREDMELTVMQVLGWRRWRDKQ